MSVDQETRQRISNLERQVKALMRHTEMPEPSSMEGLSDATLAEIREGNMMKAVKMIRDEKQCDLDEAKRIFEATF